MKNTIILLISSIFMLTGCQKEIREINVLNFGLETERIQLLETHVEIFNESNSGVEYVLNIESFVEDFNWEDYNAYFHEKFNENQVDIYITGHEYIQYLAKNDLIIPLDDVLSYESFANELFPSLWNSIEYNNHYYGIISDTDAQCVYINKSVLKEMGYSDEYINNLSQSVLNGDVTLNFLVDIAKHSIEKDLTEYGMLHRPTSGQFYYLMADIFGAVHEDGYDYENVLKMLEFFHENSNIHQINPKNNSEMSWYEISNALAVGEIAVYFGAIHSINDIELETTHSSDFAKEQYVPVLFPAIDYGDSPSTISKPMIYTLVSNSKYKSDIKEILKSASLDFEQMSKFAVSSYHFPVHKSSIYTDNFKASEYLNENLYMLDYTTFLPNDENITVILNTLYESVSAVESGNMTPMEALDYYYKPPK